MRTLIRQSRLTGGASSERGARTRDQEQLIRYYSEAGPDYGLWSRRLNMHFGYWRWPMNPFGREAMLEGMNAEVLRRLEVAPDAPAQLCDMGCGVGTPARYMANMRPRARVTGLTLVPWQIERARELNRIAGVADRVEVLQADYTAAPFAAESFDAAYAIESACYAPGKDKAPLLQEARRLLRPGGRLVIADGFLRTDAPMNPVLAWAYEHISRCWSLPEGFGNIHDFRAALEASGFVDVKVEDISMRIVPSAMHIPWVSLKFLVREVAREWLRGRRVGRERWNNLIAPVLAPLLGASRRHFGYYLVSARRP